MEAFRRQLVIRRKVVERIFKDLICYREEVLEHQQVLQQMQAAGREESDIRQRQNVLLETQLMLPNSEQRLAAACKELGLLLADNSAAVGPALQQLQQQQQQQQQQQAAAAGAEAWLLEELKTIKSLFAKIKAAAPNIELPLQALEPPQQQQQQQQQHEEEDI
ncbi:tubulin-specific chaperone a, putative [Eimeria tenella]|uniref:Tubulin-specific chaperone A n=1 Tax=Eimeria tenella TaxID=5802 RepID=U6L5Y6_EIMTE|nr:tubulin-specific chaperone a, putative [Eimeria tenella]CDJ44613.1 tubulin-specific chaperone a, putative [Eimeria tenella]|eukprot:XP_013235361.1 tubulin-specific chaperone a, putative [Eimeria tenella]